MRLQDDLRGTQDEIKGRLRPAMERLRQMWPGHPGRPLLDLFSGRGEWLELMHEAGLRAYGIDSRRYAVEVCEAAGLDVRQANPIDHLRGLPDASLGVITMIQAIDRMPIEELFELLQQIRRALIAEGVVLLEASNPANLAVATTDFYEDPTRQRPVPPGLGRRMLEHAGFVEVELLWLGGPDQPQLRGAETAEIGPVAKFLAAAPEYALIARRA
jgi:O-antigen chain-terminating methyltransferase